MPLECEDITGNHEGQNVVMGKKKPNLRIRILSANSI